MNMELPPPDGKRNCAPNLEAGRTCPEIDDCIVAYGQARSRRDQLKALADLARTRAAYHAGVKAGAS